MGLIRPERNDAADYDRIAALARPLAMALYTRMTDAADSAEHEQAVALQYAVSGEWLATRVRGFRWPSKQTATLAALTLSAYYLYEYGLAVLNPTDEERDLIGFTALTTVHAISAALD